MTKIKTALLSVSDKTDLIPFAKFLGENNIKLLSTGGTAKALRDAGLIVIDVSEHTGSPEIMDGRVKTLHPKIHGGLLGVRGNAEHRAAMDAYGIEAIDLAIINLYPFEATVAKGAGFDECIENIDIGGPSMVRSAAKNHGDVTIVTDPEDYARVRAAIEKNHGATTPELRRELAAKAFALTAKYDSAISGWFARQLSEVPSSAVPEISLFPQEFHVTAQLKQPLRYGENPHQQAAFYRLPNAPKGIATAEQLQGKELSYNNINDTDAAWELVSDIAEPAVAIIKHANPCGVATATTMKEAYLKALACDKTSAFGGIIALNRPLDAETAEEIAKQFAEVIIAPQADLKAVQIIAAKKNLRLLVTGGMPDASQKAHYVKSVSGGFLVQEKDAETLDKAALKIVTKKQPNATQMRDLLLAFTIAKHVKSNTIVLVKDGATIGIGARADESHRFHARRLLEGGGSWAIHARCRARERRVFPFPR